MQTRPAIHPLNIHSSQIWKHIKQALNNLERLAIAGAALVDHGREFPFLARNSEDLLVVYDEVSNPVENFVLQLIRNAVRDHIDDCGDGGTTLIRLIAALVEYWEAEVVAQGLNKAQKQFQYFQKIGQEALSTSGSRCKFNEFHVRDYAKYELDSCSSQIVELVLEYLKRGSEYSKLSIKDGGMAQEPKLEASRGYILSTSNISQSLDRKPWNSISKCLIITSDQILGSPESLQKAFRIAADTNRTCIVFCRNVGSLVTPTILGNYRNSGAIWQAYEVTDLDKLKDIAALSGSRIKVDWNISISDLGELDSVQYEQGQLILKRDIPPTAFEEYILNLQERISDPDVAERMALLTGDLYTLYLGNQDPAPVRADTRNQLKRVLSTIRQFQAGTGLDYATQIRQFFPWDLISEHRREIFFHRLPNRALFPFPACIANKIWDRACATAAQILFTGIALIKER